MGTDAKYADALKAFERLLKIVDDLRAQCPWDKKQTMQSLRSLTIEETFELSEAILDRDPDAIKEELGDVLTHVLFHSRIASDEKSFNLADVMNGLADKLIHRHPHIYGDAQANTEEEVLRSWEKIKQGKNAKRSVLQGVPQNLPSLIKAMRVQEKASLVGFDWDSREEVWENVTEEMDELLAEIRQHDLDEGSHEKIKEEFGDLLQSLVNYARFIDVNAEEALELANRKFMKRFKYMEQQLRQEKRDFATVTRDEWLAYWKEAKRQTSAHITPEKK